MKKHTVTISNNFVRNVKRMWDSPFASYKEIIQNALRAGAKTIQVSYNADQTLIVEDDGQGFDDIDSLLTIGDSGWGDEVVEPAGVGIFAAPAFAEEVT
ncbi:MAG: ATP-binding protein, partial [Anaerolineales bacterium]|nr:ATP-binding protein [Anaerolineales bacterium]